jgi:DNA-directed RNA polymerase II subunit RPB1
MTVFLKPADELDKDRAANYATMMEHTRLVDVIRSIEIRFDPQDRTTTIDEDALMMAQYYEFEQLIGGCEGVSIDDDEQTKSKWIVRMEMDAEVMLDKNITMDDIHFAIANSQYGKETTCIYSDYNSDKLIFRIRMNSAVFNKTKKKGVAETLDQSDEIYLLKNFQDALMNNIVLRGVNSIENVMARKVQNSVVKEDGKYVRKDTWVLDTTGTNMMEVLALDYIDATRTYSNDIREIKDVLGIEAARQTIFQEMTDVMEFSDVYINYHHLSLLCDRMTCSQNMVPIFRSGLLKDDVGPIAKATFEVHTEVLLDAARHGECDHMRGVSANVMCGQYGFYGTSSFQIMLDMAAMEKMGDAALVSGRNANQEIAKAFDLASDETNICSRNQLQFNNNIANLTPVSQTAGVCMDDYDAGF